jgi:predicted component of type VI protein secretion system
MCRWRLFEVDSSLAEVDHHKQRLLSLICPSQTYMDLNIGAALWLAARAQGFTSVDQPSIVGAHIDDSGKTQCLVGLNDPSESTVRNPVDASGQTQRINPSEAPISSPASVSTSACEQPQSFAARSDLPAPKPGVSSKDTDPERSSRPEEMAETGHPQRRAKNKPLGTASRSSDVQMPRERCASSARVLLVGSGADEQCAGYGRHRTKFREGG